MKIKLRQLKYKVKTYKEAISEDELWYSMEKCRRNVNWKPAVKRFYINAVYNIRKMHSDLIHGIWVNGKTGKVTIYFPKKRDALSIPFRDRVYQRSLNDNILYPEMTKHFVWSNCACQKGKGPDFARNLCKKYLWKAYCNWKKVYALQMDIKGYYPNMRHDVVNECFRKHLDEKVIEKVEAILDNQYLGDVGYNPGSQMVQIAGISVLNPIDHLIKEGVKENLKFKYYIRYMDDLLILSDSVEKLKDALNALAVVLGKIGFSLHEKKTKIIDASKSFDFLGFNFRLNEAGKIIMKASKESVKRTKRKLSNLISCYKRGSLSIDKLEECAHNIIVNLEKGKLPPAINKLRVEILNIIKNHATRHSEDSYLFSRFRFLTKKRFYQWKRSTRFKCLSTAA